MSPLDQFDSLIQTCLRARFSDVTSPQEPGKTLSAFLIRLDPDLLIDLSRRRGEGRQVTPRPHAGGRFVAGYTGEQFGLPEAVELLRAVRRSNNQFLAKTA